MGNAEPYSISVGHAHIASTTGWPWLLCRKRQAPVEIERAVKISWSAEPVIGAVMELDAELELVITADVGSVVI